MTEISLFIFQWFKVCQKNWVAFNKALFENWNFGEQNTWSLCTIQKFAKCVSNWKKNHSVSTNVFLVSLYTNNVWDVFYRNVWCLKCYQLSTISNSHQAKKKQSIYKQGWQNLWFFLTQPSGFFWGFIGQYCFFWQDCFFLGKIVFFWAI